MATAIHLILETTSCAHRSGCAARSPAEKNKARKILKLGLSPRSVLAQGPHVERGFLEVVTEGRRPALRVATASDREEQRTLLDGVRHTDAFKRFFIYVVGAWEAGEVEGREEGRAAWRKRDAGRESRMPPDGRLNGFYTGMLNHFCDERF